MAEITNCPNCGADLETADVEKGNCPDCGANLRGESPSR